MGGWLNVLSALGSLGTIQVQAFYHLLLLIITITISIQIDTCKDGCEQQIDVAIPADTSTRKKWHNWHHKLRLKEQLEQVWKEKAKVVTVEMETLSVVIPKPEE